MAQIQWSPSLDTGIEVIDIQHRKIISMVNDLHELSASDQSGVIDDVLQRMHDYVTDHFSFEEELMQAAEYPYLNAHSLLHQRFVKRMEGISQRHNNGDNIHEELSGFLGTWLTHHIGHEDQDYVADVSRIMKDICL